MRSEADMENCFFCTKPGNKWPKDALEFVKKQHQLKKWHLGDNHLQHLNKTSYGTLSSLSPALAALTGFMLLGEKITYLQTVALICIMLASVGVTVRAARQGSAEKNA